MTETIIAVASILAALGVWLAVFFLRKIAKRLGERPKYDPYGEHAHLVERGD